MKNLVLTFLAVFVYVFPMFGQHEINFASPVYSDRDAVCDVTVDVAQLGDYKNLRTDLLYRTDTLHSYAYVTGTNVEHEFIYEDRILQVMGLVTFDQFSHLSATGDSIYLATVHTTNRLTVDNVQSFTSSIAHLIEFPDTVCANEPIQIDFLLDPVAIAAFHTMRLDLLVRNDIDSSFDFVQGTMIPAAYTQEGSVIDVQGAITAEIPVINPVSSDTTYTTEWFTTNTLRLDYVFPCSTTSNYEEIPSKKYCIVAVSDQYGRVLSKQPLTRAMNTPNQKIVRGTGMSAGMYFVHWRGLDGVGEKVTKVVVLD